MDNDTPANRRTALVIASLIDSIIGGIILLVYAGFLPFDISGLGVPRWMIGVVGGLWFFSPLCFLTYLLTKTDASN